MKKENIRVSSAAAKGGGMVVARVLPRTDFLEGIQKRGRKWGENWLSLTL